MKVPFYRPSITEREIEQVVACLRSGWLTTGPVTREFEAELARYVGAKHAVALNSCTAALHLALDAIGLQRGDLVLVPTMTFAATAEVVRYFDATPVFVDCDPVTQCIDVSAARTVLERIRAGDRVAGVTQPHGRVRAIIPMHYAGQMVDVDAVSALAAEYDLVVIEDAAHTLPAFTRSNTSAPWRAVGTTAAITCFSFYANKCITTGEGGMAVTDDDALADRMRLMSLHGMSKDAWKRYTSAGSWYYEVVAPGFKYNLTDVASAIGRVQLERANELWEARRATVARYHELLEGVPGLELPREHADRRHSWHLFSIRLDLGVWHAGRDAFIAGLKERGIGASVHWMPLHMQPYYRETYGFAAEDFPVAASLWPRLVTLPLFPGMTPEDVRTVADAIREMARD
ncbi:MAG: DegT/DnrJ/EryC1/StrS aminotransferase family protein [Deltaproteobacteria bacterium]|nr:DegT/DnrJ/EryC1/StrS aminotransferase family protein [Deltaproteobacteria bacterium]